MAEDLHNNGLAPKTATLNSHSMLQQFDEQLRQEVLKHLLNYYVLFYRIINKKI